MNQIAEPLYSPPGCAPPGKGRVVIFAAGDLATPSFSTIPRPACAPWRSRPNVLLKGTKVDGVYSADPVLIKDAVKYDEITYMEILRQGLKVMDLTAVSLCKDNNLPMIILHMNQPGNIRRVVLGKEWDRW